MKFKLIRNEKAVTSKAIKTKKAAKKTRKVWNPTLRKYTWKKIKPRVSKHSTPKAYSVSIDLGGTTLALNDDTEVQYVCLACYNGEDYDHECKFYDYEHHIPGTYTGDTNWNTLKKQFKEHNRRIRVIVSVDLDPKDIEFADVPLKPPVVEPPPPPKTVSSRIQL